MMLPLPPTCPGPQPRSLRIWSEPSKRTKYGVSVAQKGWTFKPFTLLAEEGAYGGGADDVITKLAKRIAAKEQNEQAKVESLIRRRIAFAVMIRGSSRCIRSKRVVWNKSRWAYTSTTDNSTSGSAGAKSRRLTRSIQDYFSASTVRGLYVYDG